ncbi:MAG TPA: response regulator transcription factor, partial [Acidimicrobiia bacterium]
MRGLQESGLHVDVVPDGATALTSLRPQHLLVIVDDEVGMDPVELCRMLRSRSEVPVIVITAEDHEERVVGALEAGADDVVVVPARTRELVARARAAIRRGPEPKPEESAIEVGEVRLDPTGYVVSVDGERIEMTRKEFELLRLL